MPNINSLINEIANFLAEHEKAYDIPGVCGRYGLDMSNPHEANSSKRTYIKSRLASKDYTVLVKIAKQIATDYEDTEFIKRTEKFTNNEMFKISTVTRSIIIDELLIRDNISGQMEILQFLNRVWDLSSMPSTDYRFSNAWGDIYQHMVNNNDWDYNYLLNSYLNITHVPDEIFLCFLEQVVHPLVRSADELTEYITFINEKLSVDDYTLSICSYISQKPVYKACGNDRGGVSGEIKNLIFASTGPKPEIVLRDALNNDIDITRNAEYCLVYNKAIPFTGLSWNDLVYWWNNGNQPTIEVERVLYMRLKQSLDSEPEKLLFHTYYKGFRREGDLDIPALIPQVYLHFDPLTIDQRGRKLFTHQRMDFVLLLSNRNRIVIEIDGKQHYSEGDRSSPQLYADMVKADRELKLTGYDVYRFGGQEFVDTEKAKQMLMHFFSNLFCKYGINKTESITRT